VAIAGDNVSAEGWLRGLPARGPASNALARWFVLWLLEHGIALDSGRVPGEENVAADTLSRPTAAWLAANRGGTLCSRHELGTIEPLVRERCDARALDSPARVYQVRAPPRAQARVLDLLLVGQ